MKTEPFSDFWDEYYAEVNERPSAGEIIGRRVRADCNNMTHQEREEALNRSLDRIYANQTEKDPRNH